MVYGCRIVTFSRETTCYALVVTGHVLVVTRISRILVLIPTCRGFLKFLIWYIDFYVTGNLPVTGAGVLSYLLLVQQQLFLRRVIPRCALAAYMV